jgi:hypothetical protein
MKTVSISTEGGEHEGAVVLLNIMSEVASLRCLIFKKGADGGWWYWYWGEGNLAMMTTVGEDRRGQQPIDMFCTLMFCTAKATKHIHSTKRQCRKGV